MWAPAEDPLLCEDKPETPFGNVAWGLEPRKSCTIGLAESQRCGL